MRPQRLAESEKQFRDRFESDQQYQYFLQSEAHGSQQVLRGKIKRSLLIEDYLQEQVHDKSSVTCGGSKSVLSGPPRPLQTAGILRPPDHHHHAAADAGRQAQRAPPVVTAEMDKQMQARAEDAWKQAKATKNYEAIWGSGGKDFR